jgi:hypothetical protein
MATMANVKYMSPSEKQKLLALLEADAMKEKDKATMDAGTGLTRPVPDETPWPPPPATEEPPVDVSHRPKVRAKRTEKQEKASSSEGTGKTFGPTASELSSDDEPWVKVKAKPKQTTKPRNLEKGRAMGPDIRDPRLKGWPCGGGENHVPKTGGNQHGQWVFCTRCGVRLGYTPMVDAPGESTATSLPANVTEATNRLEKIYKPRHMDAKTFRAMIKIVAAEKSMKQMPK